MTEKIVPQKKCTCCNQILPATNEFFYKKERGIYGLYAQCKSCHNKKTRKNKNDNPERTRQLNRKHSSKYRIEHPEISHAKSLEWNKKNRDRANRATSEYHRRKPEIMRVIKQNRRARKLNLPNTFTSQEWNTCLGYFHYTCAVCGCQLRDLLGDVEPHADHWIPLSHPDCTGTVAVNMVCLCNACNQNKHAKLPEQWLTEKYGTKKAKIIIARVNTYFETIGHRCAIR